MIWLVRAMFAAVLGGAFYAYLHTESVGELTLLFVFVVGWVYWGLRVLRVFEEEE